jgi:hypothetical protein
MGFVWQVKELANATEFAVLETVRRRAPQPQ